MTWHWQKTCSYSEPELNHKHLVQADFHILFLLYIRSNWSKLLLLQKIRRANSGASWEPSSQKLSWMAKIICQKSHTFIVNWKDLAKFTHFCRELTRSLSIYVCIFNRMFPLCYKDVSRVFLECFRRGLRLFSVSFSHKNVIKKLTTMSKNPAFSQKVWEDWPRLPNFKGRFLGLTTTT